MLLPLKIRGRLFNEPLVDCPPGLVGRHGPGLLPLSSQHIADSAVARCELLLPPGIGRVFGHHTLGHSQANLIRGEGAIAFA